MLIAVIFLPPFQTKYLEQSKEIQQNKTGLKNFDIYIQCLISGRETGH